MFLTRVAVTATLLSMSSTLNAQGFDTRASITDTLEIPVRYESVGGHRIAYYEAGPAGAPVVVLIPTLRWNAHSWAQNLPYLARTYRVIAIDPLGTGLSDKPVIDYKMSTWTDGFSEFLRAKGIDRAVFVGAEMGGALAVEMALDHPDQVRAIVVAASNSGPGAHEGGVRRVMGGATPEGTKAGLVQEFYDSTFVTDDVAQTILARRVRAGDGHTIRSHLSDHRPRYTTEELARINVPALFLWCREDRITPASWGRDFAAPLPRGRFRLLERCGHYPHLERPREFNEAVLAFLQSTRTDSIADRIRSLDRELLEATIVRRDASALRRHTLDALRVIPPGGLVETKEQAMRGVAAFAVDSITVSSAEVVVHDRTAVVISRLDLHGEVRGAGRPGPLRALSVYVETGGEWKLLSRSLTPCLPQAIAAGRC